MCFSAGGFGRSSCYAEPIIAQLVHSVSDKLGTRFGLGVGNVSLKPILHCKICRSPFRRNRQRWLGLSAQPRAIAKWSGCRFHAAARSGWLK